MVILKNRILFRSASFLHIARPSLLIYRRIVRERGRIRSTGFEEDKARRKLYYKNYQNCWMQKNYLAPSWKTESRTYREIYFFSADFLFHVVYCSIALRRSISLISPPSPSSPPSPFFQIIYVS